jgi:8-oxo-dGTP diphosphatase
VEKNESAKQAAARELKEETGLDADPNEIWFSHALHRNGTYQGQSFQRVDLFFEYRLKSGQEPANMEPHKCDEARWFYFHPADLIEYVTAVMKQIEAGSKYSEWGWFDF